MFGLKQNALDFIKNITSENPNVKDVLVFGSRVMGNYKSSSDVDLVLIGNLTLSETIAISGKLNDESPTPYFYDILHYDSIKNERLREHIMQFGKSILHI